MQDQDCLVFLLDERRQGAEREWVRFFWDDLDQDQWCKITRIIVHKLNRWIRDKIGFIVSFDVP